jgi:cytochrome c oxidase assembly protein subunit 15
MVLLGLIVVTGAAVRLTKSGLGCPTWPQCGHGSFVTRPAYSLHGWVEFGNRLVSLGVGVVIALVVLGSFRLAMRRPDLRWLAGGLVLGFMAQAVLGGLTVIFHLNPALVAGHFLVSMALLFNAAVLDQRSRQPAGRPVHLARRELILLADVLVAASAAVLVLGTVVTGAGPHSGDTGDVQRFEINIRSAAQLHADGAMLLTGLVVAMLFAVRLAAVPSYARTLANALAIVVLGQITIGFTQYFLNIPTGLVAVHVAGATTLWILALYLRLALTRRGSDGLNQLVERDSDEQHGEISDGEVEQAHGPWVAAG